MGWLGKTIIYILVAIIASDVQANELVSDSLLSADKSLIVEVRIGRYSTGENIEVYQHEGGFLVPLGYLTEILDFPIEVNFDNGQAYGWFIRENRTFLLDINKNIVVIGGKQKKLDSRKIISDWGDTYVDSSLFSEWFPVNLELDFSRLILKLKLTEKLPYQEKLEREQTRNKLSRNQKKQNNYPKIKTDPAYITAPFFNFDIGSQYDSQANPETNLTYNILSTADIAKLSTNLYVSADSNDSLISMRLNAGNKDIDGQLLGLMRATEYSVGDINSVQIPLVSNSDRGRGIYISNFNLTRPDQFDQTSFIGDSQPGWEVEIYRNGELLEFQLVGEDGRYEFKNIPVLYGNNSFKIVSYGPQGQIEEKIENYSIDDSILKRGTLNYKISIDQKGQTIFSVDEKDTNFQYEKKERYIGDFEYGLMDNITLTGAFVSAPLEDKQTHNYQTVGVKGSYKNILAEVNTAYDYLTEGKALQVAVNTRIKNISTRLEHKEFRKFVSEEERVTNTLRKSTSQIDLNGRMSILFPAGISYGLSYKEEKFVGQRKTSTYNNRLATSIYAIGLSNDIRAVETISGDTKNLVTTGSFALRGSYKKVFIRLSSDYDVTPTSSLTSVNLSLQKKLTEKLNIRSNIRKDLGNSDLTSLNLALNKEYETVRLSAIGTADTNDNYSIGARMSLSLGYDDGNNKWFAKNNDITNSGAVSAKSFIDNNYNNIYDEDEDELLQNVGYRVGHRRYTQKEGDNSVLMIGSEPFRPVDVEINSHSLDDPFLTPSAKGYNITTRPGVITKIEFPVTYTTEIDGTIYYRKSGKDRPISRVIIELKDKEGVVVSTTKSEYDGFYILSGVVPGEYNIVIGQESLDRFGVNVSPKVPITIQPQSDFVSGIDVVIKK